MWDHNKLGECWPPQESIIRYLKIDDLKLNVFCAEIILSPDGHRKSDPTDRCHCYARDYAVERCPTGT
jgi:hypothetical protein